MIYSSTILGNHTCTPEMCKLCVDCASTVCARDRQGSEGNYTAGLQRGSYRLPFRGHADPRFILRVDVAHERGPEAESDPGGDLRVFTCDSLCRGLRLTY